MIDAIIFDYGGVIVNDTDPIIFKEIAKKFKIRFFRYKLAIEELLKSYQIGNMSDNEFWNTFSQKVKRELPKDYKNIWINKYASESKKNAQISKLLGRLKKAGYKLAVLSNTIPPHAEYNREQKNFEDFDIVVLSCEIGMRKPSEEIYRLALNRLDRNPEECIYIDDNLKYVRVANQMGIHGIHYTSYGRLVDSLRKLNVQI